MKKETFIRYGSLVPQQHDQDEECRTFHTAPVEYGFYAFPVGYVERFLLGGVGCGSLQNGRWSYLKDADGKRITGSYDDFYEKGPDGYDTWKYMWREFFKRRKLKLSEVRLWVLRSEDMDQSREAMYSEEYKRLLDYTIVRENPPRKFTYDGLIWHHLDDNPDTWRLCPSSEIRRRSGSWVETDVRTWRKAFDKFIRMSRYQCHTDTYNHTVYPGPSSGVPLKYFDKDVCEVFIEKL